MSKTYDVNDLTLEEKASLTSGGDLWHLQPIERLHIPGWMLTDGPHGLRKAVQSKTATDQSVPATCFPPAAGLSSSWNPDLVRTVGAAMAEECVQEKVGVILGPGINIKRNPLGGRSFEFWSEDPVVAGHQGAALVEGIQSKGVGASLKHFAVNNQETGRLRVSAVVSQRALREIYLPAFEYVVKHADPWTIMCAYNKINGVYASQNSWLLTDILRREWGYQGVVMSDWGACHDRVASLNAGLNLEMPPSPRDAEIVEAVQDGRIDVHTLDTRAQELLDLVTKAEPAMSQENYRYDPKAHQEVARKAADESIVLLKNDEQLLPLPQDCDFAVIGEFARTPRYQGGGSSHITPTKLSSFLDALEERGITAEFAPGFTLDDAEQDESLSRQAEDVAGKHGTVLMFMGLPESSESEGYDRTTLGIPAKQIDLLHKVAAKNPHTVVVLSNGSVVSMQPWQDDAQAIVESWLLGQAGGEAVADIVFGDVNPSGKLAQTIVNRIEDDPSFVNFPGGEGTVLYGEDVFVGYRYYDTVHMPVSYPFGFGLSYTTFALSDLQVEATGPSAASVSVTLSNTGKRHGAQVVQLYVAPPSSPVRRPTHELRAFDKVSLDPGESQVVHFDLTDRDFAYWSEQLNGWHVVAGKYGIEIGTSSRDIACLDTVQLTGDGKAPRLNAFSTYAEWKADRVGGPLLAELESHASAELQARIAKPKVQKFIADFPITMLESFVGGETKELGDALLERYDSDQKA